MAGEIKKEGGRVLEMPFLKGSRESGEQLYVCSRHKTEVETARAEGVKTVADYQQSWSGREHFSYKWRHPMGELFSCQGPQEVGAQSL